MFLPVQGRRTLIWACALISMLFCLLLLISGNTAVADTTGSSLSGVVIDKQRNGVPDATVFAFSPIDAQQVPVSTDEDGRFTLDNLTADKYTLVIHPPNGLGLASTVRRDVIIADAEQPQVIELEPGYVVSGTVTVSGADTNIHPFAQTDLVGFGLPTFNTTDTFTFNLAEGTYELTFTPDTTSPYAPVKVPVTIPPDAQIDVELPFGFTVQGIITGTGAPLPEVEIVAKSAGDPVYGFTPTDLSGSFAGPLPINNFPYDLIYIAPPFSGFGSAVKSGVTGQAGEIVDGSMELPGGYTLSGQISCQGGLANAFVFADPNPPLSAGQYNFGWGDYAGADGRFALALQPGTYRVVIVPPQETGLPDTPPMQITVDQDMVLDHDFNCPEPPPPCDPDAPNAIVGTEGRDRLIGTSGDDIIIGLGGDDLILGLGGNDCIDGGSGMDIIRGNAGHDLILGGDGADGLNGGPGNDQLFGGSGPDRLQGESGNDLLDGGEGVDKVNGRSGTNICYNHETFRHCFTE